MEAEILSALTQFGVAGMVCAMWLIERRSSAKHEQQIHEAHESLIGQMADRGVLIEIIRDNTRALSMLESGQRGMIDALTGRWSSGAVQGGEKC